MTQHQIDKLKIIMDHYGYNNQREIFVEECAEAIQAVQKCKRALKHTESLKVLADLKQEIADVLITANQMKIFLGSDAIDNLINLKLDRQIKRIQEE